MFFTAWEIRRTQFCQGNNFKSGNFQSIFLRKYKPYTIIRNFSFKIFAFLFQRQNYRGRHRDKEICLLVRSPDCQNGQSESWVSSRSPTLGTGAPAPGRLCLLSQEHYQGAGLVMEQPALELAPCGMPALQAATFPTMPQCRCLSINFSRKKRNV